MMFLLNLTMQQSIHLTDTFTAAGNGVLIKSLAEADKVIATDGLATQANDDFNESTKTAENDNFLTEDLTETQITVDDAPITPEDLSAYLLSLPDSLIPTKNTPPVAPPRKALDENSYRSYDHNYRHSPLIPDLSDDSDSGKEFNLTEDQFNEMIINEYQNLNQSPPHHTCQIVRLLPNH